MADKKKIVLAYSGGLDTSVAIRWLQDHYEADIVTLTMDLGANASLDEARDRALTIGAIRADILDVREEFVRDYVWPANGAWAAIRRLPTLGSAIYR